MQQIRARLTFANVVACMALFLALGGTGYAATQLPKNSVGTKQLKAGAVTTAKLKARSVTAAKIGAGAVGAAQIGAGAVGTAALADGAVTGAKVDATTLGTVPSAIRANSAATAGDAATLGGRPAAGFIQGEGQIFGNAVQLERGDLEVPILSLPGFGPLTASCETGAKGGPQGGFGFFNSSGTDLSLTLLHPGGTDGGVLSAGNSTSLGGVVGVAAWTLTLTTLTSPARIATLNLGFDGNATPTACVLTAQAVITG